MSKVEQLAKEVEQLDRHEQFLLFERLARNLGPSKEHTEAWSKESQRRADAYARGEIQGHDADKVMKELRKITRT